MTARSLDPCRLTGLLGTFRLGLAVLLASWFCFQSDAVSRGFGQEDEAPFSGPQVGEPIPAFEMEPLDAGDSIDFITQAGDAPVALIFVHEVTRPALGLVRAVSTYVESLEDDELKMGLVLLTDDVTESRNWSQRARQVFPTNMTSGIYAEGLEGPGSYGLNRNVTLTVLVGKEGEVTANFALVQPSAQSDGMQIANAINELIGLDPVTEEVWRTVAGVRRRTPATQPDAMEDQYRQLMRPVIQADADEEAINEAAEAVEAAAAENGRLRARIGNAAKRIVDSGNLSNYGNEFSQAYLRKWAEAWATDDR